MKEMLVSALVLLCVATDFGGLKYTLSADIEKGKALYQERCMICHGPNGDGKGQGAIALNPKPANYTQKKFWEDPNIEKTIAETIMKGKGQMRASPDLTPEDIQALISYMTQTFKPN